jgi:hypothetical protein
MGYKFLGFIVWQGGKWYVRRRVGARRKVAIVAVSSAAVAGLVAAQRLQSRD